LNKMIFNHVTMKKTQVHHKQEVASSSEPREVLVKKNWVPFIFVGALVVLFLFLKFSKAGGPDLNTMKTKVIPEVIKKVINNPSTKYEITSVKETNGMIEFGLKVAGQQYTSYISRDGKLLFTSGIKVDDLNNPKAAAQAASTTTQAKDIKKVAKPDLTAFIVSNCPYGLQMQRVFKKAYEEIPDILSSLTVRYIGSVEGGKLVSMHDQAAGGTEATENLRQICIREEQKEKYWPYVSCYMQEGNSEQCLGTANVSTSDLSACMTDASRGVKYAQADFALATKYKVSGSPTLLVNNSQTVSEFDFGGRNPNAIKEILCASGSNQPEYCKNEISKNDVAVSLSLTDEVAAGSGTTTSAAGCAPAK